MGSSSLDFWLNDEGRKLQTPPSEEFMLKETRPRLGVQKVTGDKITRYDLIEKMYYLYVQVVKARDLLGNDLTSTCDPYAEVKLGKYKGVTTYLGKTSNPEWNQVFAFLKDQIQASLLEITVKDKDSDEFMGRVPVNLIQILQRVQPDSPSEPQWYGLEDREWNKVKGELLLAIWWGTQADEAFPEAWHSDAVGVSGANSLTNVKSKVYLSPNLWYLRVKVIQAQDLIIPGDKERSPEFIGKAVYGNQALSTKVSKKIPYWNEDLMFVVAETPEEPLILTVDGIFGPCKHEVLGRCVIPLQMVDRRSDCMPIDPMWYRLEKYVPVEGGEKKKVKFSGRIHVKICLEGGYHVLDESTHYSSDFRPAAQHLRKSRVGVLELGILSAQWLSPMKMKDGRETTDAYCVAKYGQKWVRTRTITDTFDPKWNEQHSFEVFDPCTVVTIGVFDNCHLKGGDKSGVEKDSSIGKIRIRLSTLETGRVYTHLYPLLVLQPSGVKKMGELHLAVRFTCSSWLNMICLYSEPLLPKMHFVHPLTLRQLDTLRHQAMQIVSRRLCYAEPPLRKEVVAYMLDVGYDMWSIRRSKANFFRVMGLLGGLIAVSKWFNRICGWKNPITTVLIHVLFTVLVLYPGLILPAIFIYFSCIGWSSYRWRPRQPLHVDTRLSHADNAHPDELDEEFDTFPTTRPIGIVRMRYDRLRSIAGRVQTVLGDLASEGERLQYLLSWRDTRATVLFLIFCHVAVIVLYFTPFKVVALLTGFYILRHPRFRHTLPSVTRNFFRRLPSRTDSML